MLDGYSRWRLTAAAVSVLVFVLAVVLKFLLPSKRIDSRKKPRRMSGSSSDKRDKKRGSSGHEKPSKKSKNGSSKSNPSLPTICLLVGIHGSGKSTWARQYVEQVHKSYIIISSDVARSQLTGTVDNYDREAEVEEALLKEIARTVALNRSCIVDDCQHNLSAEFRAKVLELVDEGEYNRVARLFPIKPLLATTRFERDRQDGKVRYIPTEAVLDSLYRQFNEVEPKLKEEGWRVESL